MPNSPQAQPGPQQPREAPKEAKAPAQAAHPGLKQTTLTTPLVDIPDVEKQRLLSLSEISIILDTYDDIFSDFDPRPYDVRSLSDDFLLEVKKATRQKGSKIELKVMMPEALRKPEEEAIIKKRVKAHYRNTVEQINRDVLKMRKKGGLFILVGVVILTLVVLMLSIVPAGLMQTFFLFLFEPAGWFTLWNGFDYLFIQPSSRYEERDFYHKMSNSDISFISY
ncbi:MAG: hypothetical protein WCX64_00010 [Candidatus Micrarchaeia archaeon]